MKNCNEDNCNCPKVECENHGKCCRCINRHRINGKPVYCMRDALKANKK